jgi:hypothetical protein
MESPKKRHKNRLVGVGEIIEILSWLSSFSEKYIQQFLFTLIIYFFYINAMLLNEKGG